MPPFVRSPETALQISQLSRQGALILSGMVLAKSGLSLSDIGTWEMLLYIASFASFFWVNGLIQGLITLYPQQEENLQTHVLRSAHAIFLSISAVCCTWLFFWEKPSLLLLTGRSYLPFFGTLLILFMVQMSTYLLDYLLLLRKDVRGLMLVSFLYLLQLPAIGLPVWLGFGIGGSLVGLALLAAIKHLWLIAASGLPTFYKNASPFLKRWLKISWPLSGYALLSGFAVYFDLWLLGWYYSGDAGIFAIYRYGAREIPVSLVIASTFSTAMLPMLAGNQSEKLTVFKEKTAGIMHGLFPLTMVLLLSSWYWVPLLYSRDFNDSVALVNIMLLLIISRVLFPQTLLIAKEESGTLLRVAIMETLLKIVLSMVMISLWGLIGLAWSTVIAATFEKLVYVYWLQHKYSISFSTYTPLKWWIIYSLATFSVYLLVA